MALGASRDDDTYSISRLYGELTGYLDDQWGRSRQRWVLGEIQELSDHRSGHCYLDLVDPSVSGRDAPTLKAKCWRSSWGPLKDKLSAGGLSLEEGSVVRVRGYVDLYAPRGELGFIITSLDLEALRLAALGEHARRREELIARLRAEGILEANSELRLPAVPLRVGLVASQGTEGYNDFLGMLDGSGFGFRVTLAKAAVQGARAPAEVAAGIAALETSNCDVICVVRGGGSQADLSAFDDETVAYAIARCALPVLTGIGHTGDVSVADLVANQAFRTPTACAEGVATIVRDWYATHVAGPASRAAQAALGVLDEASASSDQSRRHLAVVGRQRVGRVSDRLTARTASIARLAPTSLDGAAGRTARQGRRIGPLAQRCLALGVENVQGRRVLLGAYDPRRLMARGWSITTDASGALVRSTAGLTEGAAIETRLADGVARSTVTAVERAEG